MAKVLKNMKIAEVSIVDEPANDEARVVIVKSKSGGGEPDMAEIAAAISSAIESLSGDIVEKAMASFGSASPETAEAATAILQEAVMDLEALTKSLEETEAALTKSTARLSEIEADNAAKDTEITKLRGELAAKDEEITKAKTAPLSEADQDAEFLKSLPEAARERILKDRATLASQAEEIAKSKDAAEEQEYITKAKDLNVGDAKVVGPILRRIAKGRTTADDAATIETVLKSLSAVQAKSELFKSLGTSLGDPDAGNPEAVLKSKAVEIQKANEGMTYAEAYTKALEQNPDLYAEYNKSRAATRV